MSTVAETIVSILSKAGTERIYSLIGDSLNPLGEAVRRNKKIQWISVRHEETASFAAGSEAFLTGKTCVCAGSCGPGSIRMINGLYESDRNGAPVLAIVSQIPSTEIGLRYFQETDPMKAFKDCSVFCETVSRAGQMPRLMTEAMYTAAARKGVAVLIVPQDVFTAELPDDGSAPFDAIKTTTVLLPNEADVRALADIVNAHERITLYCGIGCRKAKAEVMELAQKIKAPVVHTLRAKDFMETNNPFDVGLNGLIGDGSPEKALTGCDLLMLLGTDFPFSKALPTRPDIVQIDSRAAHLGRRCRLTFGLKGGMKPTLNALLPFVREKTDESHLSEAVRFKNDIVAQKNEALSNFAATPTLRPEYLTHLIDIVAPDNAVFVIDVGLNDVWAARFLHGKGTRRIIGSFKHASIGAALPEAVGAAFASGKKTPIVVLAGDGGLTSMTGDLATVKTHELNIKTIVFNNGELGYITYEAEQERLPPFKTKLENPDFARMAESFGLKAFQIGTPAEAADVLRDAFNDPAPVLIDALTDPEALP